MPSPTGEFSVDISNIQIWREESTNRYRVTSDGNIGISSDHELFETWIEADVVDEPQDTASSGEFIFPVGLGVFSAGEDVGPPDHWLILPHDPNLPSWSWQNGGIEFPVNGDFSDTRLLRISWQCRFRGVSTTSETVRVTFRIGGDTGEIDPVEEIDVHICFDGDARRAVKGRPEAFELECDEVTAQMFFFLVNGELDTETGIATADIGILWVQDRQQTQHLFEDVVITPTVTLTGADSGGVLPELFHVVVGIEPVECKTCEERLSESDPDPEPNEGCCQETLDRLDIIIEGTNHLEAIDINTYNAAESLDEIVEILLRIESNTVIISETLFGIDETLLRVDAQLGYSESFTLHDHLDELFGFDDGDPAVDPAINVGNGIDVLNLNLSPGGVGLPASGVTTQPVVFSYDFTLPDGRVQTYNLDVLGETAINSGISKAVQDYRGYMGFLRSLLTSLYGLSLGFLGFRMITSG